MSRRRSVALGLLAASCAAVLTLTACGVSAGRPVTVSREVLGTVVTITVYGSDDVATRSGAEAAFADMMRVEAQLDPYDTTSTIATLNAAPYEWHDLPPDAATIFDRVGKLGVTAQFSPALLAITNLYDFGGRGSVPASDQLAVAVVQAQGFARDGARVRFAPVAFAPPPPGAESSSAASTNNTLRPGLDFGGAAKGLALDRAMERLRATPGMTGAMITAGSSTQVWGRKGDGEPWRIGIEDPRATGKVVAVIGAQAPDVLNLSTSGDYQLFFDRGGVRYHHILDPATGRPARGLRSLTVYGNVSGLDADILSTALFVAGPDAAKEWTQRNGVGLYAIDHRGRVIAVSAPKGANVTFERTASPRK
ncbi:MAG: FAD:protein FMN transferase [Coriobacteriia bacterium]|nr:FAD:protein FMN transferase [Coriobacteriia bacterium]